MIRLACRRGRTPYQVLCTLCVAAGLDPMAWTEMSAREFVRALQRRCAS